jgi:hypothetical protein
VAVSLRVKVPRAVPEVVRTFSVALPEVVTGLPVHVDDAFDGSPDTLSVTDPVKPPVGETFIVYVAVCPRVTVLDAGLIVIPKSGWLTTSVSVT